MSFPNPQSPVLLCSRTRIEHPPRQIPRTIHTQQLRSLPIRCRTSTTLFLPVLVVYGPPWFCSTRDGRDPKEACTLTSAGENVSIRSGQTHGRDARAETDICTRAMPLCVLSRRSRGIHDVPALRRRVDVTKGWVGMGQPRGPILLFSRSRCIHTSASSTRCFSSIFQRFVG